MTDRTNATYLGDGLYVKYDDSGQVVLFAHNGYEATNTVYLEPEVMAAFFRWIDGQIPGGLEAFLK